MRIHGREKKKEIKNTLKKNTSMDVGQKLKNEEDARKSVKVKRL